MTVNYTLKEIVQYHRKQAKLTRIDLADLAGVGKTVIYDIEKGKETIKWSTITAVLNALNIEIKFEGPLMESYEKSISENA
ncbi:MAG: helix-turn-helix domain-containing protein [Bacteroidetes bacterium]|nr:helix-turn-helix domain-containing protein [Bacteroidota bacterium]MDA1119421.1 helix-turn-helix domain-containing protein [Bacteroidota bacterium]